MINTVNTKQRQLRYGYFSVGNGDETLLVIGSCRTVPYLNYLLQFNTKVNYRFTICFIDPFNFNYDEQDNRIGIEQKINSLENDENLLQLFKKTKYFIHEFYGNFGMFNCDKKADKNIYQFGLNPEIDICIPNWNDIFVLFGDIVTFDLSIRKKAVADYNVIGKLSDQTTEEMFDISQTNLNKFYNVCMKSDLPEMREYFQSTFREKRMWWNSNHVSKHFTLYIFSLICSKFLKITLTHEFVEQISEHDMYANNYTKLSNYDISMYGYKWDEHVIDLKEKLF